MLRLLLLASLVLAPPVSACGAAITDEAGDQSPSALPGYYDLLGLNVTRTSDGNVTWTWLATGIEQARDIEYWGQVRTSPAFSEQGGFHPKCMLYTVAESFTGASFRTELECELLKGTRNAGAVTFERVATLQGNLTPGGLSVQFSMDLLALAPDTWLNASFASTEVLVHAPVGDQWASPHVADTLGPADIPPCAAVRVEPPSAPPEPFEVKESPAPSFALVFGLLLTLVGARGRRGNLGSS